MQFLVSLDLFYKVLKAKSDIKLSYGVTVADKQLPVSAHSAHSDPDINKCKVC